MNAQSSEQSLRAQLRSIIDEPPRFLGIFTPWGLLLTLMISYLPIFLGTLWHDGSLLLKGLPREQIAAIPYPAMMWQLAGSLFAICCCYLAVIRYQERRKRKS